jgi:gas vesicle protein
MTSRKTVLRYLALGLAAGAVGAAAGLLLAPASGRETRRRVRRRLSDERAALLWRGQRAVENARGFIRQQLREVPDLGNAANL